MEVSAQRCLGRNLKLLRASRDINQSDMADLIGLARSSYTQYELGNRIPDAETLYIIAKFFRIRMDLFFEPEKAKFLSEVAYSRTHGENDEKLMENYRQMSPFLKGRLIEFSEKLVEWDKIKENNLKALEGRRQVD